MLGKESCKGFLEALSKMSLRMGPTWMSWCGKKKKLSVVEAVQGREWGKALCSEAIT